MFDHEGSPRLTLRVNYYSLPLNYASLPLLQEKSGHESERMAGTKPNANERKRERGKVQDCRYFYFSERNQIFVFVVTARTKEAF